MLLQCWEASGNRLHQSHVGRPCPVQVGICNSQPQKVLTREHTDPAFEEICIPKLMYSLKHWLMLTSVIRVIMSTGCLSPAGNQWEATALNKNVSSRVNSGASC